MAEIERALHLHETIVISYYKYGTDKDLLNLQQSRAALMEAILPLYNDAMQFRVAVSNGWARPAPTPERVRDILRSLNIEEKTFTSMIVPPLACSYGLSSPEKIMEFARKLVGAQPL